MASNEKTSKKVASIAGRLLRMAESSGFPDGAVCARVGRMTVTIDELKALCASALTQAPDKPKRKNRSIQRPQ